MSNDLEDAKKKKSLQPSNLLYTISFASNDKHKHTGVYNQVSYFRKDILKTKPRSGFMFKCLT